MNTKQLQLVTGKQAKRLDKLGFNWINKFAPTPRYDEKGVLYTDNFYPLGEYFTAPTVALALKWIRDEKGKKCTIEQYYAGDGYWRYEGCIYGNHKTSVFDAYEAAESALLDKLLYLLEKEKEQ
jgi:hypothetical protein